MPKIGYNINLGGLGSRYTEAQQSTARSGGDYHLLMTVPNGGVNSAGNIQEIMRWQDAINGNIIWRTYSTFEGDWVKIIGYRSMGEFWRDDDSTFRRKCREWANQKVAEWEREGLKHIVRDDPINEPGLDANNRRMNERYVIRCVELVNAAKSKGFTVAIGAFSVGTPHEDMIEQGVYDPLLQVVDILSVHEYPTGVFGAGDLFEYEAMFEPETIWGRLPKRIWATDKKKWLMRRCDRLYLRAKERYGREIGIIITETNTSEDIPDAHWVVNQIKRNYGLAECSGDLRGHQAWRKFYNKVFGHSDFNKHLETMVMYMAKYIYDVPYVIGVCLFSLNEQWGTGSLGRWRCHNYLGDDCAHFRRHSLPAINASLIKTNPLTPPKETPVTTPPIEWTPDYKRYKVSVTDGFWNLRESMTTNSTDLGDLTTEPVELLVSTETLRANGFDWYAYKDETVNEQGYFADTEKLILAPVEEPPKNDDTGDDIPPMTDSELAQRVAALEAQIGDILAIKNDIETEVEIDLQLGFTFKISKYLRKPFGLFIAGMGKELVAKGNRIAGITTLEEVDAQIYGVTASSIATDVEQWDKSVSTVTPINDLAELPVDPHNPFRDSSFIDGHTMKMKPISDGEQSLLDDIGGSVDEDADGSEDDSDMDLAS